MAIGHKRKRHEQDTSNADQPETSVCHGSVKRDLLQQSYAVVLTLREYMLLKLPSSSRLRRKKINSLGKSNEVAELEATISNFLDSTLICDSDAVLQTNNAAYAQWLSFSQKGDESHVTISGAISESQNTQSEVGIFSPFLHCNFESWARLIPNTSLWILPSGPCSIKQRNRARPGQNTFSAMGFAKESRKVTQLALLSRMCTACIPIITPLR
jgi:hypothetical protein